VGKPLGLPADLKLSLVGHKQSWLRREASVAKPLGYRHRCYNTGSPFTALSDTFSAL